MDTRELFSPEAADAGDAAYQRFETRFKIAQVVVVVAVLGLAGVGITLVTKVLKGRKQVPQVISGISL